MEEFSLFQSQFIHGIHMNKKELYAYLLTNVFKYQDLRTYK